MRSRVLTLCTVLLVAGCAGVAVTERLDSATGVTLVTQSAPRVFARNLPQYSRSGRDYLYLGPVEANRQGRREYFLWVGLASTIDPRFLAPRQTGSTTLYMEIGGELMALPLQPWDDTGVLLEPVYESAVAVREAFAAPISLDQLRVLAGAQPSVVHLEVAGGDAHAYMQWRDTSQDWSAFLARVRGVELAPDSVAKRRP